MAQVPTTVARLLTTDSRSQEEADQLASTLSGGTWTHDHAITLDEARAMGLPVSDQIPDAVLQLMTLYPQPVRTQSTVKYRPERRRKLDGAKHG